MASGLFGRGSASAGDAQQRKEALKTEITQQLALVNAQELVNKMTEKCFKCCVTKPGIALGSTEQGCLNRCMDRWLEAYSITSKTYFTRLAAERRDVNWQLVL